MFLFYGKPWCNVIVSHPLLYRHCIHGFFLHDVPLATSFFSHFFCVSYNKYFSVSLLRSIAVQFFILSISYVYIAPAVSFHVQTVVQCWLHSPTLLPWFSCCKGRDFFLFIFYYLPLQLFFCAVGRVCTKAWRSLCHFFCMFCTINIFYRRY